MSTARRTMLFAALVVVCAVAGIIYVLDARADSPHAARGSDDAIPADATRLDSIMAEPHVVLSNTGFGDDYGKVEVAATDDPDGPRALAPLDCARVAMAGGTGICLTVDQGIVTTYSGKIFDESFEVEHTFPLPGRPSRARVSPDGRYAAMTVFVFGDSYAASTFSTRTIFVDTTTGESLGNLEDFEVTKGDKTVDAINRNYWGVTFAPDSNTFYATLGIGDGIDLIEGDVSSRTARVINEDIECPSLSPDGTRDRVQASGRRWAPGGGVAPARARPGRRHRDRARREPQRRRPGRVARRCDRALRAPERVGESRLRYVGGSRGRKREARAPAPGRRVTVGRAHILTLTPPAGACAFDFTRDETELGQAGDALDRLVEPHDRVGPVGDEAEHEPIAVVASRAVRYRPGSRDVATTTGPAVARRGFCCNCSAAMAR